MNKKKYVFPKIEVIRVPELCVSFQEDKSNTNDFDFAKPQKPFDDGEGDDQQSRRPAQQWGDE